MLNKTNTLKELFSIELNSETEKVVSLINEENEDYHENFGFQWNTFNQLQLDSYNGSNESEGRLLNQSEMSPQDFHGKVVLEVGAGNGRFTEILHKYGAKVIAVDFSSAIYANFEKSQNINEFYKKNTICNFYFLGVDALLLYIL